MARGSPVSGLSVALETAFPLAWEHAEALSTIRQDVARRARAVAAFEASLRAVCYSCREDLPGSAFHRNGERPNGLTGVCKPCASTIARRRRDATRAARLDAT